MAVLARDDFFSRLQERVGTATSDEDISFIEDMTDTFNDLENRANGDGVDWEQRYHELDESWKQKYKHRFFSGGGVSNIPNTQNNEEDDAQARASSITFNDLFK